MNYRWLSIMTFLLISCQSARQKNAPDISKIQLNMPVVHWEKDFLSMDTLHLERELAKLKSKYGVFYNDFLFSIAAFSPREKDNNLQIRNFIAEYKPLADSIAHYIPNLVAPLKQIENGLKRAKVYFPHIALPGRIITYIGPIDSYGAFIDEGNIAVGLQQFLGPNYTGYQTAYINSLFGDQKINCFSPAYIAPTAILAWITHEFPDEPGNLRMIDKMVEEGRKLYVLKCLLPELPDSLLFGYDRQQMEWCARHSSEIDDYFESRKLFDTDKAEIIIQYLSDQQSAENQPKDFPNNIGKYVGYNIVSAFMIHEPDLKLIELLSLPLQEIANR